MNINDLNIVLRFHPWESTFPINTDSKAPCSIHKGFITITGKMYVIYEYRFKYRENAAIGCCWWFCSNSKCLGYHEGDTESLVFLVDRLSEIIHHVYFKAHGRGQGVWRTWDECEKTQEGDLIAYVARGSHAFYPRKGIYVRVFGLANDLCSEEGENFYIQETSVSYEDYYIPNMNSIKSWERFILLISKNWIKNES